ncbi:MAG: [protein-PII] uridylyltransferase, partial [Burkholderiaceae bacterium]
MKLDRDRWQSERTRLVSAFHSRQDPRTLLKRLAAHADESLIALWRGANLPASACLIAVGGYGRGELFPGSDLDLLILIDETLEDDAKPKLEAFIGACWDLGLDVGHAVRSVEQCLKESAADITVQTSLLEARLLIGPRDRMLELAKRLSQQQDAGAFFEAKQLEMRQRHLRFDDSPYSLEPHVKESPGGLRDLQLLIWLARAAGMPTTWLELSQVGVISREEYRTLQHAQRLLTMIRISLHRLSGRREDRLVFDLQVRVAQDLGIGAQGARRASEALMQRYYMAAKRVSQMRSILMQLIESYLFDRQAKHSVELDEEFVVRDDMLALKDPSLIDRDLSVVFRAFLRTMEQPGIRGMAPDLLRAIWLSRPRMDARFRRLPANRSHFMQVLMQGRGVTKALYDMNQWSVLGRYLPEWRRIVGRMQHDLFHVYTVDQHILTVLRNVQRFSMPEHVHEFPLCSEIMAAMERPWRLSIAALYHDIAKGRGGDHSSLGAAEVRRFCRAHGIEREDSALIEWLVEHHLAMSSVAQKQDISDPEIVEQFAKFVVSEERLNALYLLTVADIRGTSPKVWNSWKGK